MKKVRKELIVGLIGGVLLGLIIFFMIGGQITLKVIALMLIGSILTEISRKIGRNIRPIKIA